MRYIVIIAVVFLFLASVKVGYGDISDSLEKLADMQVNMAGRIAEKYSEFNTKYTDIKFKQLQQQLSELKAEVAKLQEQIEILKHNHDDCSEMWSCEGKGRLYNCSVFCKCECQSR